MKIYDVSGEAHSIFEEKEGKTQAGLECCMGQCQIVECEGNLDDGFVDACFQSDGCRQKCILVKGVYTVTEDGAKALIRHQVDCFGVEQSAVWEEQKMQQELCAHGMTVLNGLDLKEVPKGQYLLSTALVFREDSGEKEVRILLLKDKEELEMAAQEADLWQRAIEFATMAHKGAVRKGTKIPYIVHPVEASNIVYSLTDDLEIVAAAALHDVIEDTIYGYEDLKQEFGKRVADFVQGASENKRRHMKAADSWKIRKQEALEHMKKANREEKMIALGDKLSNMRATSEAYAKLGDKVWNRFNVKDKKMHAWYYCGARDALKEFQYTEAWKEFDMLCKRVFG